MVVADQGANDKENQDQSTMRSFEYLSSRSKTPRTGNNLLQEQKSGNKQVLATQEDLSARDFMCKFISAF